MSKKSPSPTPFFKASDRRAVEIGIDELAFLQHFFELNPEYFISVNGEPAGPNEAYEEVCGPLPTGWSFTQRWVVGILSEDNSMVAMLNIVSDLLAKGVWHIGLFIVASELWGTGASQSMLRQLESWVIAGGAKWLRLGVVEGNARAERFWERAGFVEVRKREGLAMGTRVNTVRVMVKPLAGGGLTEYLALVERDNPRAS